MTAVLLSVTLLAVIAVILIEPISLRLTLREKLTLTVSGTVFAVELSSLGRQKKRKSPDFTALGRAARYLLSRGELTVRAIPEINYASYPTLGVYTAFISILLAYLNTSVGKLDLQDGSHGEGEEKLDLEFTVRLWVLIFSFILYKTNAAARRFSRVRKQNE